nr:MarR family transcriptional regulator [candidate division Zixibacteria bacterium]
MENRQDIMDGVGRVWLLLKRYGRKRFSEINFDFTFEQAMVLFILRMEEGLKIGEIAERTDRDRTTTSRMINGLEKKNLVVRVPDQNDSRQKLIYLTRQAKDQMTSMDTLRKQFAAEVFRDIGKKDILKAAEILHKIADNIGRG